MEQPATRSHSRVQALLLGLFAVALSAWSVWMFSQRGLWLPELASVHGEDLDHEFMVTLAITGFMFVVVQIGIGFLAFRFSSHRNRIQTPGRAFENRFAIIAAAVVFLVDISLFAMGEASFRRALGVGADDVTIVEVTGEQFAWNFRYPGPDGEFGRTSPMLIDLVSNPLGLDVNDPAAADDVVRINQLHIPIERPVRATIRSKDVIHSFSLPNFRVKQDAVPGMAINVTFQPTETGSFEIVCNQICGLGHYRMRAFLTVESMEEFETWLADEEAGF